MCSRIVAALLVCLVAPVARGQEAFVDDAGRSVAVPPVVGKVFAAGAPPEVLLYTLVPDRLVGRNHAPSPAALEFMAPQFRDPVLISQLPDPDGPAADRELLALRPDLYVDYGDVTADYIESLDNVQRRTGIPGIILDGSLARIPATYRRLGQLLGAADRGEQLAAHVEPLLAQYRGILRQDGQAIRVYLACSPDGLAPCLDGERNAEFAQWLGAVNVAGAVGASRRVTLEQIRDWNPDVIVAPTAEAAARLGSSADWQGSCIGEPRCHLREEVLQEALHE